MGRYASAIGLVLSGFILVAATAVMSSEPLDGEKLVQERCTQCHNLARVDRRAGQDQAWWERTVNRMISKRSDLLSDAERAVVVEYLTNK